MFNSPARPIKGTPKRVAGSIASRAPRTPSVFSEREREHEAIPSPSTARTNRLAQLRRDRDESPSTSVAETIRTVREVEGYEKVSWSRDDRRVVNSLGALPKEVNHLIQGLNCDANLVNGVVDTVSGYAMVVSSAGCKAWNYVKRTHASPTCYTFPSPAAGSRSHGPDHVLGEFFSGSNSEPGVIMVTLDGEVRTWENISLGLGNTDRFQEAVIDLEDDDSVDKLWKISSNSFVVTTRRSNAFRINISTSTGRATPHVMAFSVSRGMFSRASTVIFANEDDRNGIVSLASRRSDVFILAWRILQRWTLSQDSQKLAQEYDIVDIIGEGVFGDEWKQSQILLEINDIATLDENQLVALVGYTDSQSPSSSAGRQHRSYGVAVIDVTGKTLGVTKFIDLAYSSDTRGRAVHPRLLIPAGSPVAFVRFLDALVILSLSPNAPYEDVVHLKQSNSFIGYGCRYSTKAHANQPSLVLMPASGGLLSIEALDMSARLEVESNASAETHLLISKLEQAVFFGDRSDNPLSFTLPADVPGDVGVAVEQISNQIVASTSRFMPAIYELRAHLLDRANRLRYLMTFIRESGLMGKITQSSRRRLQCNAEKVQAALELWDHQNRLMDKINTRSPQSLLSDCIRLYMSSQHPEATEDIIRLFFRTEARSLDQMLDLVYASYRASVDDLSGDISDWTIEVNTIFLRVLRESARLREDEQVVYEIDRERPADELWTSQDSFLQAMEYLFSATERLIQERTRDLGSVIDERPVEGGDDRLLREQMKQERLKDQMTYLGASLCSNMEDRVRYASTRQLDGELDERAGLAMGARWVALRPRIIRPMAEIDRVANAYNLAEHHQDWETLVWLCHHAIAGRGPTEVQKYIELYGEEFAFVLYQWYIDNNHRHALLGQDKVYSGLVSKFFDTRDYPDLAWMHHLACRRYGDAGSDLLVVDQSTESLAQKHVIRLAVSPSIVMGADEQLLSSIGKLAAVVERKALGAKAKRRELLEDLDDELDDVKIQTTLRESLMANAPTPTRRGAQPSMADYATSHSTCTGDRPTLRRMFVHFAQKLVDGSALDTEALVDVLTLKDTSVVGSRDPVIALEKLLRDTTLPSGRRQVVLLSIWRRVYIRDDWEEISNTSGRSDEAQRQLLRQTLVYQTLKNLATSSSDLPLDYELDPEEASQEPLLAELSARFPDWPADEIDALMREHEDEIATLAQWRSSGLERMAKEVKELVRRDVEMEAGSDVDAMIE